MPQIYYLWDFEDGTMQGWEALDPDVALDSTAKLQGTYSVRISKSFGVYGSGTFNLMRIRNINIQNTNRPLFVFLASLSNNIICDITVILQDSLGNQIGSFTFRLSGGSAIWARVLSLSLEPYKSSLNSITLTIYMRNPVGAGVSVSAYFDMFAIVEADTNYNTSLLLQTGEIREVIKTLGISVPSSRFAFVSLASPPWFHQEDTGTDTSIVEAVFIGNDGASTSLSINSADGTIKHVNSADITALVSIINRVRFYLKVTSITANYAKYTEYVSIILMSNGFASYNYIMLFKIQYTVNPHTPMTQTGSVIITPGQSVTKSFEMTAELRFNSGGVRLRIVNVTGNYTDVLGGTITLSVYDYYTNELIGSASVNPLSGNNLLSDLVVINPDTRYRFVITFNNISVKANVAFRGYIVYEVS